MNKNIINLTKVYLDFKDKYMQKNDFIARWFNIFVDNKPYLVCLTSKFSIMIFDDKKSISLVYYLINNQSFDFGIQADYYGIGDLKFYYEDDEHLRIYNKKVGSFFKDATPSQIKKINNVISILAKILDEHYEDVFNSEYLFFNTIIEKNDVSLFMGLQYNKFFPMNYRYSSALGNYNFKRSAAEASYIDLFYYEFPMFSSKRNDYIYPYVLCISDNMSNVAFYVLDYDFDDIVKPVLDIIANNELGEEVYISNGLLYEKIKKTLNKQKIKVNHIPLSAEGYCTFVSLEYNIFRSLHQAGNLFVEDLSKFFFNVNLIYDYCNKNEEDDGYIDKYLFETTNKYLYDLYEEIHKYDIREIWNELENNFSIKIADTIPEPTSDDNLDDDLFENDNNLEQEDDLISDLLN